MMYVTASLLVLLVLSYVLPLDKIVKRRKKNANKEYRGAFPYKPPDNNEGR